MNSTDTATRSQIIGGTQAYRRIAELLRQMQTTSRTADQVLDDAIAEAYRIQREEAEPAKGLRWSRTTERLNVLHELRILLNA